MRHYEHKREPLSKDDANKLANECSTIKEKLVVWTLLDTGLRVEELCNLDKKNIDWSKHSLKVYGKNTKGGAKKPREVPITNRVRPILETWLAANDKIGFTTKNAWEVVKKVSHRACIGNCSPHVLRHTFAVLALERGVSIAALQKVLGHNDLSTTAIYLNKSGAESIREFLEKW